MEMGTCMVKIYLLFIYLFFEYILAPHITYTSIAILNLVVNITDSTVLKKLRN